MRSRRLTPSVQPLEARQPPSGLVAAIVVPPPAPKPGTHDPTAFSVAPKPGPMPGPKPQ